MRIRTVGLRCKGKGKVVAGRVLRKKTGFASVSCSTSRGWGRGRGEEVDDGEGEVFRVQEGDAGWEKEAEVEFERYVEGLKEKYRVSEGDFGVGVGVGMGVDGM